MSANLKRTSFVLVAALLLSGCSQRPGKLEPWVWPGANRCNTRSFDQDVTEPVPKWRYVEAWEAEWFDVPATEPIPVSAHAEHRPLVFDLDRDGRLEIVTSPLSHPPAALLNWEGAPFSGRTRGGLDWDQVQSDAARILADDSAGWVLLPESSLSRPGSSPMALRLNQRTVTLEVVLEPRRPYPSRMLECRDATDGRLVWRYEFGARPDLMAVADLDADGREELLVTTYGDGNGAAANGTRDSDSCYCVALRDNGTLLWQRGFGAHPFIGCLAGIADLDGDGKQDVFVNIYSWQNDFGGLAVLDGATGWIKSESPSPDSSRLSHVSAGCADVDGDGQQELAVAISGRKAEARLYRLTQGRLELTARVALGEARDTDEVSECRLHAICDLDGDGKRELVLSRCRKRMICRDPKFYPSTFDSCGLLVLDSDLRTRQEIGLPVRCQDVTLGDVIPGGNIEMLVVTDRLLLYSAAAD
ncbi:VCBS repeat-containing protein [candidate division WOR-3 bacterium]|uniref:VCBS repeat-containing protein n=1 Tax=candidate division WOR-3 bacterium TaxID=2052148 RepID=A0A937XEM9_UNCW3|nr:VCBS repeat-containing protein [candidate division WOR-3 bacterium]